MTGPLAFFTNCRSGDMVTGSGAESWPGELVEANTGRPVSTAIPLIIAVRIMNARRSMPSGTFAACNSSTAEMENTSSSFSLRMRAVLFLIDMKTKLEAQSLQLH